MVNLELLNDEEKDLFIFPKESTLRLEQKKYLNLMLSAFSISFWLLKSKKILPKLLLTINSPLYLLTIVKASKLTIVSL